MQPKTLVRFGGTDQSLAMLVRNIDLICYLPLSGGLLKQTKATALNRRRVGAEAIADPLSSWRLVLDASNG